MAIQVKGRDLVQITCYLPTKVYERLNHWKQSVGGVKSESEAVLRCPRSVLFPGEFDEAAIDATQSKLHQLEAMLVEVRQAQAAAPPPPPTRIRWLSTREAFDALVDADVSYERFRRLTPDQLLSRFNLASDLTRRIPGSNTSRWLHVTD